MKAKLCKTKKHIIALLALFSISSFSTTYAYWQGTVSETTFYSNTQIGIGQWNFSPKGTIEVPVLPEELPLGDVYQDAIHEDIPFAYDLNKVVEENPVVNFPTGTYFIYTEPGTDIPYLYRTTGAYNPAYHGTIPSTGNSWAMMSLDIDWQAHHVYQENHVVRVIDNGETTFYAANYYTRGSNPLTNHGAQTSGIQWTKITGPNGAVSGIVENWQQYFKPIILTDINDESYAINYPDFSQILPSATNPAVAANFYCSIDGSSFVL